MSDARCLQAPEQRGPLLLRTPVGNLHVGDPFHYRTRWSSGWVQAATADPEGRWVTGRDRRLNVRSIYVKDITRIDRRHQIALAITVESRTPSRRKR